ncbi:MAG TPA: c-type cytochrome [Flavobacteriales bacterium]
MSRILTVLCIGVALAASCGSSDAPAVEATAATSMAIDGARIFNTQCSMCHGRKGDQSLSGAKLLNKSILTKEQMNAIVTYGKAGMMAYKDRLTAAEIQAVVDHAYTLRDPK